MISWVSCHSCGQSFSGTAFTHWKRVQYCILRSFIKGMRVCHDNPPNISTCFLEMMVEWLIALILSRAWLQICLRLIAKSWRYITCMLVFPWLHGISNYSFPDTFTGSAPTVTVQAFVLFLSKTRFPAALQSRKHSPPLCVGMLPENEIFLTQLDPAQMIFSK